MSDRGTASSAFHAKHGWYKVLLAILLTILVGCPTDNGSPPPPPSAATSPGVNITILSVSIPFDRCPVVSFTMTDDKGNRIPKNELTDGRFILGHLEENVPAGSTRRYISYTTTIEDPDRVPGSGDEATQATYDTARLNGITENADGTFTYKFAQVLPVNYSLTATHELAGQFRRLSPIDGESYVENPLHTFRPNGMAVVDTRHIVDLDTCNRCHTRLALHGDVRREVQLCIQCHNGQTADAQSGNSVDFAQMIHKIHRGEDLPSVAGGDPYQIIGFGNSVNDYSTVVFPQDIRDCTACHDAAKDTQEDVHLFNPTIEGCASCHDRTWFGNPDQTPDGFIDHVGGQQVNNNLCSLCHPASAPGPSPILEAHLIPQESDAAPGLTFEILDVDVTPTKQGNALTIRFIATDKFGDLYTDLAELNSVAAAFAFPVAEYEHVRRESIRGGGGPVGNLVANQDGSFSYTFAEELPAVSDDTFAVAMDGRVSFMFREQTFQQGTSSNARTVFTLAKGDAPLDRRPIVDEEKCAACHKEIRAHGESRVGTNYCVMCHNPSATDVARKPSDQQPPATVSFKEMIHRIHSGEDLTMPYTVFGFGGVAHDFTEVRFSGRREACDICHVEGSYELPLPDEALSTIIPAADGMSIVSEKLPERAACTSCHDDLLAEVHAMVNTDFESMTESCAVCHGADAAFAVELVHLLEP